MDNWCLVAWHLLSCVVIETVVVAGWLVSDDVVLLCFWSFLVLVGAFAAATRGAAAAGTAAAIAQSDNATESAQKLHKTRTDKTKHTMA